MMQEPESCLPWGAFRRHFLLSFLPPRNPPVSRLPTLSPNSNPTQTNLLKIRMSNSDKFQQDDAIVAAEPEVQGVLAGDDVAEAGDESVANNKIGQGES